MSKLGRTLLWFVIVVAIGIVSRTLVKEMLINSCVVTQSCPSEYTGPKQG